VAGPSSLNPEDNYRLEFLRVGEMSSANPGAKWFV